MPAPDIHTLSPESRTEMLRKIMTFLDLTTLDGTDNNQKVTDLCDKALRFRSLGLAAPAAVCVYPVFVGIASKRLKNSGISVASVAGGFPSGQMPLHLRVDEVRYAVQEGADEIDMVISRGKFLEGSHNFIVEEVSRIKEACGNAHLKVILETGELATSENIILAGKLAIQGGADFIKTSTGKIQPAATLEAMEWMLGVIRETNALTGKKIGIKPAGGISTPDQALQYSMLIENILGEQWLTPELFRIGASRLADNVLDELGMHIR